MQNYLTFRNVIVASLTALVFLGVIGWQTREDPAEKPYLEILGKSFVFNYRIAEAYYGFTAYLNKPVANYSRIEAEFEDPAGGAPFKVVEKLSPRTRKYALRSPPVTNVERGKPYRVTVRLVRKGDEAVLFDSSFTITSQQNSSILPQNPLTIGPGYHRNPARSQNSG